MLSPAVGCLLLFFIIPMFATAAVSFTDWRMGSTEAVHFVGLSNYIALWHSEEFRKSVANTLLMTVMVVPVSFFLSLALALAVRASGRLSQFWQTIYFLPVTASLVAMAVVWQWILHPEVGFVAVILEHLGYTGNVNLLNDPDLVLPTLAFISVWQMTGYFMVIFLTGLVQIPREIYDAARVDGLAASGPHLVFRDDPHDDQDLSNLRHRQGSHPRRPGARQRDSSVHDVPGGVLIFPHGHGGGRGHDLSCGDAAAHLAAEPLCRREDSLWL